MTLAQVLPRRADPASAEPDWEEFYAEHLPRVLNFFRYRVGTTADVDELTARTFEIAWSGRYRHRHDAAAFATWLFTIARNVAIEHLRAHRRPEPIDAGSGGRLGARLARLPPRQRELIAMKYGAGMTNRAIARATGLSESKVGAILRRAVDALRDRR